MKGSGTLAWKRRPLRSFPSLLTCRRSFPHTHTHTAFKQGAHQKLVISLIHCDSLETVQTYLCVVHPINQEDEQTLQTQTKKERERTKLLQLFSLLSFSIRRKVLRQISFIFNPKCEEQSNGGVSWT